ncbi:MAG: hypothetical protein R3E89_03800 [Thiolinea sp.]
MHNVGEFRLFATLGGLEMGLVLGGMLLLALIGAHPVVSIALVAPLVMPLQPDRICWR